MDRPGHGARPFHLGDKMTRIIASLAEVSDRYRAVYCDLWGCLHNGKAPFPDAVAALQTFRASGGTVLLLTNSPRPAPAVAAQLDALGVPRACWDVIASSGDAAQAAMLAGAVGQRVWHLGPPKDEAFFSTFAPDLPPATIERVPFEEAEGIVCTGLFDDQAESPADYRARLLLARERGLKMLCANPDKVVDLGHKRIFCAGALAEAYAEMGGEVLYFGKPHPPIYDLARKRLAALADVAPDEVLCIGDGPETDIAGAAAEGLDALFVTEGLAAGAFGPEQGKPDPVLLQEWLQFRSLAPAYSIAHLR